MAKTKSNQKTVRTGLIFVMVWLLVASLVMTASADTSGNGYTSGSEFTWTWATNNEKTNAAGSFSGSLETTSDGKLKLTLNIGSSSSTYTPGSEGTCGAGDTDPIDAEDTINTATVTNNTDSTLKVVAVEGDDVCKLLPGDQVGNGGTFTVSITASRETAKDEQPQTKTGSVTITFETVENANVIFYGADGVSYSYEGNDLAGAAAQMTKTVTAGTSITLPAAPTVSGGTFKGWRTSHDGILHEAGTEVTISEDTSVYPVITTDTMAKPFTVNGTDYEFWTDAAQAAVDAVKAGNDGTIILNQNYTLPATPAANGVAPSGSRYVTIKDNVATCVVPSGVTLLIPYDTANTLCTTKPIYNEEYTAPKAFRTLTLESGANFAVDGAISVSGQESSKYGTNGFPYGNLGFIHMNANSTITVNAGGALYAWGYVKGAGSVNVESGGTVYECFQIADYRGGNATSSIVGKASTYHVFPFNQYYLQNIEVRMTLKSGAKLCGHSSVSVTLAGNQEMNVPFIGDTSSMFNLTSGYAVKDYIEGTGRTNLEVHGDLSINPINIALKAGVVGTLDIATKDYNLPIPNHMSLYVESGSVTMKQNVAFLPGSELYIREGTTCTLGEGANLYVYDLDQWLYNDGANGYAGTVNKPYVKLQYVPGGDGTTGRLKDALVQVDGVADLSAGLAYVTVDVTEDVTTGGANIYSTGTGKVIVQNTDTAIIHQVITADTDISSWPEIVVKALELKNADLTTVSAEIAGEYPYYASTGRWDKPSHYYEAVVTAPTCENAGYTTHTCAVCGHSYQDTPVDALGHSYESVVTDPTCETKGYTTHTCTVCGDTYTDSEVAALGHSYESVVTDPTCTEPGKTVYTCAACGDSYEEDIAALGHSYGDWSQTKAPTCTEKGEKVRSCSVCGAEETAEVDAKGHTWQNMICTDCGVFKIYGSNLKLQDGLDLYFYVRQTDIPDGNYQAVISRTVNDGTNSVVNSTIPFNEWEIYGSYYRFSYSGIAGKEMCDEVTVTIQKTDGTIVSNSATESIRSYAMRGLRATSSSDAFRTVLVDMLNYGAECQNKFGYNTTDLANAKLTDEQKAWATKNVTYTNENYKVESGTLRGASVSAKSKLTLTFVFEGTTAEQYAHVTYTDHYGTVVNRTIQATWNSEYGCYVFDVTGVAVADGRAPIHCQVTGSADPITAESKILGDATASIECYVTAAMGGADIHNVYVNLMKFVDSAHAYFHTN